MISSNHEKKTKLRQEIETETSKHRKREVCEQDHPNVKSARGYMYSRCDGKKTDETSFMRAELPNEMRERERRKPTISSLAG